jgi:two-component system response regulator YesN
LQNRNEKLIAAMRDYLRCNYRKPVGLHDLAASMRRNVCYLSTLFHQAEGVTIHRYLEELRLASAREMLRDPRLRVCEVAQAAGYSSPDAFRHAFKARVGLSPVAWRARQP